MDNLVAKKKLKCAIYTRKSTDEGLDQEYNSLDSQRDAGESYIKSQRHEGWELLNKKYDDPAYSGGNMERPALQQLIKDIKNGKVDVVVVYKVDRLSRSLSDFAKLVEIFDTHSVSFVSVTQAFNTTNSMGRLTLNILLSFAQFEREVTGERIRDKFSSSKKKGIWMGGRLVLGYDVKERKLVVNDVEAENVRFIFEEYLRNDSIYKTLEVLRNKNIKTKSYIAQTGNKINGNYYNSGTIYGLLNNQIYLGKIKHKKEYFDGEHEAIINQELWDKVQEKLAKNRRVKTSKNDVKEFTLRGKIFDNLGNRLKPVYTSRVRNNKKSFFRYYANQEKTKQGYSKSEIKYVSADELENIVAAMLNKLVKFELTNLSSSEQNKLIRNSISKLEVYKSEIVAEFENDEINKLNQKFKDKKLEFVESEKSKIKENINITVSKSENSTICKIDYLYKNFGGKKFILDETGKEISVGTTNKNSALINALVTSQKCNKMLEKGEVSGIVELSKRLGRDRSYISKILRLHYLSPKIKDKIMEGNQPNIMTLQSLINITSMNWKDQELAANI